jgi:predicted enzyme related to lactoylglutathione lyase
MVIFIGICLLLATAVLARGQESVQILQTGDKTTARELLALGDEAFQGRRYVEAAEVYKLAAQGAQREGDEEVRAEALAQVARSYLIQGKKEAGRPWLDWAREVAEEEMPSGWSRYLGVRGRFEWKDGKLEKATATFKEMYEYCLRHALHSRAVDAAHMVAITAGHEEQVVWAQKGIAAAEEGNLEGWLGPLWNNLGWTYEEMGHHQEALDALIKAREYHWRVGDEHNKLVADWSVGHAYRMLEQLDEATNWLRPVLAWAERRYAREPNPDAAEWVGHTYRELGQIAISRGELSEGLNHLRRAQEKLAEARMPEWDPEGFQQLQDSIDELAKAAPKKDVRPTIVHFEIPFDDQTRAISFYRDLFGWEIVVVPEMDYWLVNTVPADEQGQPLEPGINGGMMRRVVPYQWTINYVTVGSVDEYLRRAESLGGTVIRQKTPIPHMAWYAHVADTEGNVFGIIEEDPSAEW